MDLDAVSIAPEQVQFSVTNYGADRPVRCGLDRHPERKCCCERIYLPLPDMAVDLYQFNWRRVMVVISIARRLNPVSDNLLMNKVSAEFAGIIR